MPVIPPYPPLRVRNNNATPKSSSETVVAKNHNGEIIASLAILIMVAVLISIWTKTTGVKWWRRQKQLKAMKKKAIADQKMWYRCCRPIDQPPTLSMVEEARNTSPSALDVRGPDAFQLPSGVHICPGFERTPHIAAHPSSSTLTPSSKQGSDKSKTSGKSSTTTAAPERPRSASVVTVIAAPERPRSTSVASVFLEPPPMDLEPFPDFDPEYEPSMEYQYDIALQPLRNSYDTASTTDTTISSEVAVPMAIPARVVPVQVHNDRRVPGEAYQVSQRGASGGKDKEEEKPEV
jgi:hypothetical protein